MADVITTFRQPIAARVDRIRKASICKSNHDTLDIFVDLINLVMSRVFLSCNIQPWVAVQ